MTGRGGGTSLPGKVLLRLQHDAITRLSRGLKRGSVVISATNGKTTTASLLASILKRSRMSIVHNHAGANMGSGIATALLDASRKGVVDAELGLFEVDEAWASQIVQEVSPRVLVLANLFRDQLDRYGELETLADGWQKMLEGLPASTRVVVNADDPLLSSIASKLENVLYFGIEDRSHASLELSGAADSKHCRRCGAPLEYEAVQLGHLGSYRCPNGDFERPQPAVFAREIVNHGMDGSEIVIATPSGDIRADLPIPGHYNVYNAVAAAAAAHALELAPGAIADGLAGARAVFGRVETLQIGGKPVSILLIKNPTGANEVLRTVTAESPPFDIWLALNDKTADGHDVSWIWDVDFEALVGKARKITCSGTRAQEMALRLAYAGVERSRLAVNPAIEDSFDQAVADSVRSAVPIFALPTYTALLELRTAIAKRGEAPSFWSDT